MARLTDALKKAEQFLTRHPSLEASTLLKKESATLIAALDKYSSKAEEIELSLTADFVVTADLVHGEAKNRVTKDFIRDFTKSHCSAPLVVVKADKKARTALLVLAAKDNKLPKLQELLDQSQRYREMLHQLLEKRESDIRQTILSMPSQDFGALVRAAGLDAPKTGTGAVSSSRKAREIVLKQVLRDKVSDQLMIRLGRDA